MSQTGYTPIQLYSSSTPTNAPSAGNLTNDAKGSELAINIADKNLFFKDSTGVVNTVPIRQSSTSSNGWLSSTDWNTFNNKQPAGAYVTSVTGTAPVVSSGGTTPAISMAAATTSVNGYLTSTDWNTFNSKYGAGSSPSFAGITNSGNLTFTGTGNRITGDMSNATLANRLFVQTSTTNSSTSFGVVPNGTSTTAASFLYNNSDPTNASSLGLFSFAAETSIRSGLTGTGSFLPFTLYTNGAERARIPTAGGFQVVNCVSVGNATPSTSGAGITFPATQSASSDANTLDDYEEGTWTPTVAAVTGSYTTVTSQSGKYTKIGRQVTLIGYFIVSNKGTGSGGASITNLPFAMSGDRYAGSGYDTSTATADTLYVNTSTTTIEIYKYDGTDPIVAGRGNIFELTYFV